MADSKKKTRPQSQYQQNLNKLLTYIDDAPTASRSHKTEPINDTEDRIVYTWTVGDYRISSSSRSVGKILSKDVICPKFTLRKKDLPMVFERCKARQDELLAQMGNTQKRKK